VKCVKKNKLSGKMRDKNCMDMEICEEKPSISALAKACSDILIGQPSSVESLEEFSNFPQTDNEDLKAFELNDALFDLGSPHSLNGRSLSSPGI